MLLLKMLAIDTQYGITRGGLYPGTRLCGGGGGEVRKGSNRKKNLGEHIELSSELGKREGQQSLRHPFPGLTPEDPFPSSDLASFARPFFFSSFLLVDKADF